MLLNRKARAASKAHHQPRNEHNASPAAREKVIAASVSSPALEFQDAARLEAFSQRARVDAAAFDNALRMAANDRSIGGILERIQAERVALLGELGPEGEIESAARRSVAEGLSVREALEARARELRATREQLVADRREKRVDAARLSANAGPAIRRAVEQMWHAQTEARRFEELIAAFPGARLAWVERLRDAGLSEDEIARLDVRPTDADRAEWVVALEASREQERQLSALLRCGAAAFIANPVSAGA
ncbi:hypothetical protein P3T22_005937 [Paraburkholderia sp. GAS348]